MSSTEAVKGTDSQYIRYYPVLPIAHTSPKKPTIHSN